MNTATGDFVFGVTEAYLIENGEITEPVRAAQLIGNGPDVLRARRRGRQRLRHVDRACAARTARACPVSSGQPTVLVREMTVGGTAGVSDSREAGRPRSRCSRSSRDRARKPASRSRRTSCDRARPTSKVFGGEVESLDDRGGRRRRRARDRRPPRRATRGRARSTPTSSTSTLARRARQRRVRRARRVVRARDARRRRRRAPRPRSTSGATTC